MIVTDVIAVIISKRMMATKSLVDCERCAVNTDDEKPWLNSSIAFPNEDVSFYFTTVLASAHNPWVIWISKVSTFFV